MTFGGSSKHKHQVIVHHPKGDVFMNAGVFGVLESVLKLELLSAEAFHDTSTKSLSVLDGVAATARNALQADISRTRSESNDTSLRCSLLPLGGESGKPNTACDGWTWM